ncbi:HDOD domain-containing protein [Actinoplanes sp. NPDC051346]|uniref:EAL and HDOD domain-containing protein n=1 Tax=Actinoplanes sp. NPDC051346 TaxID=3155048 RepID=UPI003442614D
MVPYPLPGTQLVHVGRQPIFDVTGDVVAYELLFRGSMEAVEAGRRDTYATSQVIVNTFTEFGIDEVVGDRTCFINMTREFLTGELTLPFGPEHVVLEVLETVDVDDEVVAGVTALAAQGYRIALDDFVWGSGHEQLLPLADFVKVDLLAADPGHLDAVVEACREYPRIQIVAEGLETGEQLALSNRYGFELRQGYVLSRPQVLTAASLTPSKLRRLELIGVLSASDADLEQVLAIIARDPALTMRVLRASNSAAAGSSTRVSSVRQAVVMLGLAHIRQWAMLMVVDDVAEATEVQMADALTRARLCENVAPAFGANADAAFMAGLITAVAQMIGLTPAAIAHQLPLSTEIAKALERGTGKLGQVLRVVNAYERGDLSAVAAAYSGDDLSGTVMAAMRWSTMAVAATQTAA